MPRALWKGTISFGLVAVPIELHRAVRDNRPRFRMLHVKDKSPVKFEHVCEREGRPVAWEDLVKGYEYEKGKFVALTKDDFRTAALEKPKTVDILDFVKAEEIDDRFFETPYYVTPGKGGDRPYVLLREAIRQSDVVGIGKIILRDTQHLASLTVIDDALVLTMLRFADELADISEFRFPSAKGLRPQELELAKTLVQHLVGSWSPEKYTDEYRANLIRIIKAKLKGKKPDLDSEKVEPKQVEVVDLMARLRESLQAGQKTDRGKRLPQRDKKKKTVRRAA